MRLERFGDAAAAATALAQEITGLLEESLASRGAASLAVPGGRTPLPLFEALRDAPLDWTRVHLTLTDERWVPAQDAASNAALVQRALGRGAASAARFLPLFQGPRPAAEAAGAVWQSLRELPRPFDAVVLGMGEDGHFASLFPGDPGLPAALDPQAEPACVAMRAPVAPASRISLNLAALLQTRRLFLLVAGAAKLGLLEQAGTAAPEVRPVAALLAQQQVPVEIFWSP